MTKPVCRNYNSRYTCPSQEIRTGFLRECPHKTKYVRCPYDPQLRKNRIKSLVGGSLKVIVMLIVLSAIAAVIVIAAVHLAQTTAEDQALQTPVPTQVPIINVTPTIIPTTIPTPFPTPPPISIETPIPTTTGSIVSKALRISPKVVVMPYTLNGVHNNISVTLYGGADQAVAEETDPVACYRQENNSTPCSNTELNAYYGEYINDTTERPYLNDLVYAIQAKTTNHEDQARIAISLVQNIPYDTTESTKLKAGRTVREQYPYETLFNNKGVCEEKSLLLAYLLRELGFGVALFSYTQENHMALGVASPLPYSYTNSGYAFIETTAPTIPTDSSGSYIGVGKLYSVPLIFPLSSGATFMSISSEFNDAKTFENLTTQSDSHNGSLPEDQYNQWMALSNKYGLIATATS